MAWKHKYRNLLVIVAFILLLIAAAAFLTSSWLALWFLNLSIIDTVQIGFDCSTLIVGVLRW